MAGAWSWLGSALSLAVFLVARRFSAGLAAPALLALACASWLAWTRVLRVPELRGRGPGGAGAGQSADDAGEPPAAAEGPEAADAARKCPAAPPEEEEQPPPAAEGAAPRHAGAAAGGGGEAPPPAPELPGARGGEPPDAAAPQAPAAAKAPAATATAAPAAAAAPDGGAAEEASAGRLSEGPAALHAAPGDRGAAAAAPASAAVGAAQELPRAPPGEEGAQSSGGASSGGSSAGEEDHGDVDPERARELKAQGNELFKAGKVHDAREAYSEAIYLTPLADSADRAVLYSNRAACMQKLGRWEDVVSDCKLAVELDPTYVKAWARRSAAYEALEKWHDSLEDLKKAIELDPSLRSREYRRQAMLETRAQQQFEKDKDEMMGKLKDLGNTILGKFGMSTDNFKLEQDPSTGSYSVKYQN